MKMRTGAWQTVAVCCSSLVLAGLERPLSALAAPARPETQQVNAAAVSKHRLPPSVIPEHYELTFKPDLKSFTFSGSSEIQITVKVPTDSIVLNALDLSISSAVVSSTKVAPKALAVNTGNVTIDEEYEQARIKFAAALKPGKYKLSLSFTGTLNDKLRGFYRSHYTNDKGEKRWLATTQMEPTDARRMFPCFDEPEMKATFKISAWIPSDLHALSNGKCMEDGNSPELKQVVFDTSPKMSSYLVALIIGNFKPTQTKVSNGVPITVWALEGKEQLGNYALDAAGKILEYQTKYFGIPYPGKKLDLVAIPDFRSGAMENLGCITFREANLLVDEKTASSASKRHVFAIIAHEIAHQWFGDLVTMRWWDDIWLNEAFASWMGTKTVDAIHPEWQELARAILTRNDSMAIDELKATRAIHADVQDPKQAAEMFDSITYDKGESILWMLESYVGAEKFQQGINKYLSAHRFGNATSEDLWKAIGECSRLPIPTLMKSWVFQPGFPIVKASTANGALSLSQQRFFGMPGLEADNSLWNVPAVIRQLKPFARENEQITKLLSNQEFKLELPDGWSSVVINAGGRGFYRTQYEPATFKEILKNFDWLTPEERLAFLSDVNALVWKGSLTVENKLSILSKATNEPDALVQDKLVDWCWHPYVYLGAQERSDYEKLVHHIVGPAKKKLGWKEHPAEQDSVKDLRRSVIVLLGTFGQDRETIAEARELFEKFMHDRRSVPADVASAVLTVVTYNGADKEYEQIVAALKKERIPELEKRFLSSLTHFGQPELIDKTLNMVLSDEIRSQDGFRVLAGMLAGHRTKHRTWQFVKTRWAEVTKKFPPRSMSILVHACQSFDSPEEEADLKQFFATHDLPFGRSAVARMLEDVHRRVLYRQKNQEAIRTWVKTEALKTSSISCN